MCVAAVAWHAHPRWRLVAIGNRDERHDREAAPLMRWGDSGVLCGMDMVGGGTWLGVSEAGRFALITNRRGFGEPNPNKRSRGELLLALLDRGEMIAAPKRFNPFNLLAVGNGKLAYATAHPSPIAAELGHGIYGLSNGALDEPWPKTLALKQALTDWLAADDDDLAPLFAILRSEALPELGVPPLEPSDVAIEPRDTPPFIRNPLYGTRCSTVVTVTADGAGRIVERRFAPDGETTGETALEFAFAR